MQQASAVRVDGSGRQQGADTLRAAVTAMCARKALTNHTLLRRRRGTGEVIGSVGSAAARISHAGITATDVEPNGSMRSEVATNCSGGDVEDGPNCE